ncbi:uncharacterized protein JCM10292_002247 [Rhodotorula paludigena]|uniref:Uncharacterized protein n=1 Tax=Rhodotorula paludigena TaxID=86838 RepID=A0AAV5GFF5_9BASI|nr:hypothetical protein Rhopal_001048-T1 [Rhodotorula paludigena]
MGLSKKDARTRQQKAAAANGTKVETTAGGVVKKAEKPKIACTVCKQEIIASMPISLRDHANKHPKVAPSVCFPGATIAA